MKIRYFEISTTVTHLLLIQVTAEVQETKVWFEFTTIINQETFFSLREEKQNAATKCKRQHDKQMEQSQNRSR